MIDGFEQSEFAHNGIKHRLYTRGEGAGVVLMHELPGLTKECVALAHRLVDAGYRVYMPLMFGKPEKEATWINLGRVCIGSEFRCLAKNETSPIVEWLKAICHKAHQECGGPGVGAIGMCLTGNFAISLMIDPIVLAPVSCQPSLPFPFGKERKSALAMPTDEIVKAKQRAVQGQSFLCFRFTGDKTSPKPRFDRLQEEFGPAFIGTEIDSSPDNPHGIRKKAHAVLTRDFVDKAGHPTKEAMDQVLGFFEERLNN